MRYALWSAVSTKSQAQDDKISLAEQQNKCRSAGEVRGWSETAGPYIVPGATRSFYVNLSDAERDIPQLRQMLDDARNDLFDVLVIYSYDRLGDLVDMIGQSLSFYGKQIFSVMQPVEPQPPELFDRYSAEAEAIMRDAARITQRFRINDLRRKYRAGMPKRVQKGLHTSRTPFGYRWMGKKEPPQLIEPVGRMLVRAKDMFLAGETVSSILRYMDSTGIRPPEGGQTWQDSSFRAIITNPFYAGFVSIHRFKSVRDPRNNNKPRNVKLPRSKWTMEKGLHQPLWDEDTWNVLCDEMERRHQMNIHTKVRYPYSGLLYCGECRQKLHRVNHGHGKPRRKVLSCSSGKSHIIMPYDEAVALVSRRLAQEFEQDGHHKIVQPPDPSRFAKTIHDLQERRKTVQQGYEHGVYSGDEAVGLIRQIEDEIEQAKERQAAASLSAQKRLAFRQRVPAFGRFAEWVNKGDAALINSTLRGLFAAIYIHPDGQVELAELE